MLFWYTYYIYILWPLYRTIWLIVIDAWSLDDTRIDFKLYITQHMCYMESFAAYVLYRSHFVVMLFQREKFTIRYYRNIKTECGKKWCMLCYIDSTWISFCSFVIWSFHIWLKSFGCMKQLKFTKKFGSNNISWQNKILEQSFENEKCCLDFFYLNLNYMCSKEAKVWMLIAKLQSGIGIIVFDKILLLPSLTICCQCKNSNYIWYNIKIICKPSELKYSNIDETFEYLFISL